MDTQQEIRFDRWWQKHLGCCGTCQYRQKEKNRGYVCGNADSEHCADWVEAEDGCEEWLER